MSDAATLGHWLKQRRRALGLTQEQFAQRIPCAPETIRKLEGGSRRASKNLADRLATCLHLTGEERDTFVRVALGVTVSAPALITPAIARRTNLLAPPTSLIGRELELSAIRVQMDRAEVRLLTLVGPPGIGKTRLSQEVARRVLDDFPDGVFFVALAALHDPGLIASTMAQALGLHVAGEVSPLACLTDELSRRRMLLLLDNFEHLVAGADVVAELLAAAPDLKVVATSREALHLYGEHVFPVPPLAVPDETRLADVREEDAAGYPSVQLFVERARAANPHFMLNHANVGAVVELCVRLEGLPLSIELAAGRSALFGPRALLARLNDRLGLLIGGARNLPARQQTLRAAIAWSHELLTDGEQMLFRRLGVFVGGCTLEAIEAVCNATGDLPMSVLEGVAALQAKYLLACKGEHDVDDARFMMLETIREYAVEQLACSAEQAVTRKLHAEYCLGLARAAELQLTGRQQHMWLERLEQEHDNLRAALAWSVAAANDPELGLQLAGALWPFWKLHNYFSEGRQWLEAALTWISTPQTCTSRSHRAKALEGAGRLAAMQGDYGRADALLDESLSLYRELGDARGIADSLGGRGRVAEAQGHFVQATALLEESLSLYRALEDRQRMAGVTLALGDVMLGQGDHARAVPLYEESLRLFGQVGDRLGMACVLGNLGDAVLEQGNCAHALALYQESLTACWELRDGDNVAECLHTVAGVAGLLGRPMLAARLFGAAEAVRDAIGAPLAPVDQAGYERAVMHARAQADETAWEAAWNEGRSGSLEQAVMYAAAAIEELRSRNFA